MQISELDDQQVSFKINVAEKPKAILIFAHGAGADMSHQFIETLALGLVKLGVSVLRFNFPYMIKRVQDGKRRPPDRMPALLFSYQYYIHHCLSYFPKDHHALPIFIGGKSMGSRVAVTITSNTVNTDGELLLTNSIKKNIRGVVCLGYPFHPIKKPEKLRLAPLMASTLPTLIIQGDRDALGNKDEIQHFALPKNCLVEYLPDGDHDLKPRVRSGFTHQQHIDSAITLTKRFIDENS